MMTTEPTSTALFHTFYAGTDERVDGLTALDAASGDGDFGENLRSGLAAVQQEIHRSHRSGFAAAAAVFLDDVGGTSGPLFGLLFQELARAENEAATLTDTLRTGLTRGLAAIQRVGGAEPGDRTLVDALHPAVVALAAPEGTIRGSASAAIDGAAHTAALVARRGRASYVGQRAVGAADPGAVGLALFLVSAAEVADQAEGLLERLDDLLHPVAPSTRN